MVPFKRSLILTVLLILATAGCSTVPAKKNVATRSTTILFLVDGLSVKTLQSAFNFNLTPAIRQHFLARQNSFHLGQAVFPTLTYPNLTSILTGRGVDQHPVIGNQVLLAGEEIDFETPRGQNVLERLVGPSTVFEDLRARGQSSASFAYVLGHSATTHTFVDLRDGLEFQRHDYDELDGRLIRELDQFLTRSEEWPSFIYVHLVGVDGYSHLFGPNSPQAFSYLRRLDARLAPVLARLRQAEARGHTVVSLLTSDHGFVETPYFVDIEKWIHDSAPRVKVLNELRALALYSSDKMALNGMLQSLQTLPGVEMVATRAGNWGNNSYVSQSLEAYFRSPNAPDALVVAKPGFAFLKNMAGGHGGLSADELLVPVLMRNATLVNSGEIVRTNSLLSFLGNN